MTNSPQQPTQPQSDPESLRATFSQVGSHMRRNNKGEIDVMHAVGGVRGIVEALLPGFLFLTVFLVTNNLYLALATTGTIALVFTFLRLIQKSSLIQSFSGLAGVLICAVVALRTGDASNYYIPGFWVNLGFGAAVLASIVFRWPLLGLMYSFIREEMGSWRTEPQRYRAYRAATWVLFGMFALRLLVQLPLFFTNNVAALGTARLLMGVPLYAAVLWITWMMTRQPAGISERSTAQSQED